MIRSVVSARTGWSAPPLPHRSACKALLERHGIVTPGAGLLAPNRLGGKLYGVPVGFSATEIVGDKIESILSRAPGNGAPIGGIKVSAASGWLAARPSGTEDIYKIYAESFTGLQHLQRVLVGAQATVDAAISTPSGRAEG